jgi:hypothetical protein
VRDPGLYIVTLNNIQLVGDGAHNPVPVNHNNCKLGQSVNLFNRYCVWGQNYLKVFRPEDVNFCPLFWLDKEQLKSGEVGEIPRILRNAERCIYGWLGIHNGSPWLSDIEPADLVDVAINALGPDVRPFRLFRRSAYVNCTPLPALGQLTLMFV